MSTPWRPNVTVAAVIEDGDRFLFVEEQHKGSVVINQPAGHLEEGESLQEAVIREVYEETQHRFEPQYLIGVYRLFIPEDRVTYLRFCFSGVSLGVDKSRPIDPEIQGVIWLSRAELGGRQNLRSRLVTQCVDDYVAGLRAPLTICHDIT